MPGLASFAVFQNLGSTESRVGTSIGNVVDFASLGSQVTAHLTGSINDFSGFQTTFRLRAATSGGANFLTSPIVATFPVVNGNGLFSVEVAFTPPSGAHIYVLTQQTDAGTGTADELVLVFEVVP